MISDGNKKCTKLDHDLKKRDRENGRESDKMSPRKIKSARVIVTEITKKSHFNQKSLKPSLSSPHPFIYGRYQDLDTTSTTLSKTDLNPIILNIPYNQFSRSHIIDFNLPKLVHPPLKTTKT